MANAQVGDLTNLSILADSLKGQRTEQPLMPDDEIEDDESTSMITKRITDFSDQDFGFTGGNSFNNAPQSKFFKKPLKSFGYDFFVNAPSTFAPLKNIPVPPDYIIGPGDNIKILIFGTDNRQFTVQVTREGEILFPGLGNIAVAGLSFSGMQEAISAVVSSKIIGAQLSITLGTLRSVNIFILGEAFQPGMYTVSSLSTITNAIYAGGRINSTGALRNIQLKRRGKILGVYDFYDLLLKGDTTDDIRLSDGDVIFIPPITKTIGISGEVVRPGIYELKDNENIDDLILFSGNLTPKSNYSSVDIQRIDLASNSFQLINFDLNDPDFKDFSLQNGDSVAVYPVSDTLKNAVLVSGHAMKPGFYAWFKGIKLGDILSSSDDLLSMTDLGYVLIKRETQIGQRYEFIQTDLEEIFQNPSSDANVVLHESDEIILFPSLLSANQITTKLIQDQYQIKDNQMVLVDEWNSMTYLRKSLIKELAINNPSDETATTDLNTNATSSYYEYSIHDYCTVTEDFAIQIIESSGFRANKSVSLLELENVKTPEDLQNLQKEVEQERIQFQEPDKDQKIETLLTNSCRKQLLDPIIEVIRRQIKTGEQEKIVSIFGNTYFPGEYPLTTNMTINDAINAAGGLKHATYNAEVELSRSNVSGKTYSITNTFSSLSDASDRVTKLQPLDILNIKQISNEIKTVEISGEVFFPGIYPVAANQTISELIRRAGGLKDTASTQGAYFQRESLRNAEIDRLKGAQSELRRKIILSSGSGGLGQGSLDSGAINQLSSLLVAGSEDGIKLGRLVIDLDAILNDASQGDIFLDDGDSLHIPRALQTVSVIGEVYVPNSHIYKNNLNLDDYINFSGGSNTFADVKNIYLIKSNGSIISPSKLVSDGFFRNTSSTLEPGDTIVVPLQVTPFSTIKATTEITQIIYQMALAAAAVNSF